MPQNPESIQPLQPNNNHNHFSNHISQPVDHKSHDSISNLKKIAVFIFDVFKGVIILFILAILFRVYIMQPFMVDGPSMEPNFTNNEYLLVEKITPKLSEYQRGNVIVFKYPRNKKLTFIKRIIGLPGDKIEIIKGKIKIINSSYPDGAFLKEDYLPSDTYTIATENFSVDLAPGEFFVMGDNRKNSLDSRDFGPINKKLIIGKAWFSFKNFKRVSKIQYNVFLPAQKVALTLGK